MDQENEMKMARPGLVASSDNFTNKKQEEKQLVSKWFGQAYTARKEGQVINYRRG